jgi:hypothetical protein
MKCRTMWVSLKRYLQGPLGRGVVVLDHQKPRKVFAEAEVADGTGPWRDLFE